MDGGCVELCTSSVEISTCSDSAQFRFAIHKQGNIESLTF